MHGASRKGKRMQGSNEKSEEGAEKGKKTKAREAAMHRPEQSKSREGKGQTENTRNANGENGWDGTVGCELGRGLGLRRIKWHLLRNIGAYWNLVGGSLFSKLKLVNKQNSNITVLLQTSSSSQSFSVPWYSSGTSTWIRMSLWNYTLQPKSSVSDHAIWHPCLEVEAQLRRNQIFSTTTNNHFLFSVPFLSSRNKTQLFA